MPSSSAFDSVVAARTRAADHILQSKDLLARYEDAGGLKDDLSRIRDLGHRAEALNGAQSGAKAGASAATTEVLEAFVLLQREYKAVMAVVAAVRHDLEEEEAPATLLAAIDQILANEAEVTVRTSGAEVDASGKPLPKKRTARPSGSQEALRAEIAKDAQALADLKPAAAALAKRRVDAKRLAKLEAAADALAGKLATRAAATGGAKTATKDEAVVAQRRVWSATYRILGQVARAEPRVQSLLRDAAARRK